MTTISMIRFGRTLTDRPDGQKAFAAIISDSAPPYRLDFKGVMSIGSSFGDEVIVKLAERQENTIEVLNVNDGIRSCIKRVIEGTSVELKFIEIKLPENS